MHPEQTQRGFRRGDVVVLAAILGLIAVSLIPFVYQSRERENQARCLSNLRAIAIACHNHQDQQSSFPPMYGWVGTAWINGASYGTAFYHLLPYVEQSTIYESSHTTATTTNGWDFYGFWQNNSGSASGNVCQNRVRLYECPSDPSMPSDGKVGDWGAASYALNAQVFANVGSDGSIFVGPDNAPGTYTPNADWLNYPKTPDSFGERGAQTIIFAERYAQCGSYGNLWAYPPDAGGPKNVPGWVPVFAGWLNSTGSRNGYVMRPDYVAAGQINAVPSAVNFQVQPNPWAVACNPRTAQTGHTDGMRVALADGSSRLIRKDLAVNIWWSLVTTYPFRFGTEPWAMEPW